MLAVRLHLRCGRLRCAILQFAALYSSRRQPPSPPSSQLRPPTASASMTGLQEPITYPAVKRGELVEELHGVRVADPYRWLEDPDSEDTKAFVDAQNAVTQKVFDQIPYVEETKARLTELFNYEKYTAPKKYGGKYVFAKNDGLQNQYVYYIQDTLESEPRVLLDPNLLSTDGTAALSSRAFSEAKMGDGKLYFAHGISRGGSDWQTIKVLAVHDDNKILEDTVEWVKFSAIAWTHDDKGFFYSRYPPPENLAKSEDDEENSKRGTETDSNVNHQLWYHALHTPQSQDKLVYAYPADPSYSITAEVSDDGKTLIIMLSDGCKNANMVHLADLAKFDEFLAGPAKELIAVRKLVDDMESSFSYILNKGGAYYFQTNKDAPRERVVRADLSTADPVMWEEVIPEQKDLVVLEGVNPVAGDLLVLQLLKDVINVLHVYDLNGVFQYEIDLPSVGTVGVSSKRTEPEFFVHFISFLYPGTILRIDLSNGKSNGEVFRETKVKGFDASLFESKQVFYPSKDGTKIPMFIVKRKSSPLNGELPVYLYGYGGFNISLSPAFSVVRLVFVQHFGGVLALPNLRGGGEYGEDWHQDGMLFKKQNVFDDFHGAAEYLIKEGYTNPSKIAIHGGSNGGLLVAATSNQRPDLYRCAVGAVGVMDMLRFHKFTIGHAWRSDYGDPDVAADFQYLLKYSPVHNVPSVDSEAVQSLKNGGFPSVLLTTGDHDDRVVPLHSYKLIAELQHKLGRAPSQKNPLVIRIDTKSGHGAGKPLAKTIEENSEVFAFIAWNLGAKFVLVLSVPSAADRLRRDSGIKLIHPRAARLREACPPRSRGAIKWCQRENAATQPTSGGRCAGWGHFTASSAHTAPQRTSSLADSPSPSHVNVSVVPFSKRFVVISLEAFCARMLLSKTAVTWTVVETGSGLCDEQNAVPATETVRDLDDRVRQFVAALPLATLARVPTSQQQFGGGPMIAEPMALTLPSASIAWRMETSPATSLFIRPAYQALLVLALAFLESTDVRYKVEITGARGVGKTAFLSWVVYHLRVQTSSPPPAIVLDLANGNDSFFGLIRADGSVERGQRGESFQRELAMRSTFYVHDASSSLRSQSSDVLAKTIMLLPPTKTRCADHYRHARPMETVRFVMPLWTLDELDACRVCCYPRVSMRDLQELHSLWGGVPKWTLAERKDVSTAHFRKCLDALTFANAVEIVEARGWFDTADVVRDESDRKTELLGYDLIHVHADHDNTFQFRSAALCSSVACAVLLGASDKHEIRAFLDKYRGRGATAMRQFYAQVEHEYWKKLAMI